MRERATEIPTRPEEAPVATTVLMLDVMDEVQESVEGRRQSGYVH